MTLLHNRILAITGLILTSMVTSPTFADQARDNKHESEYDKNNGYAIGL